MSVLTTTRVSAPEPNADSHTNVANVQDQAIQQQTVEGDQLQQLIQLVPQWTASQTWQARSTTTRPTQSGIDA